LEVRDRRLRARQHRCSRCERRSPGGRALPSRHVARSVGQLGGGWKGLWLNSDSGKTTSIQGFELARVRASLDYRVSPDVPISPVIGGGLGMFVSQDTPMTTSYKEIGDNKVNFTGFAGIAGRFDVGGKR